MFTRKIKEAVRNCPQNLCREAFLKKVQTNGTLFDLDNMTAMKILTADKIIMQKIAF